MTTIAQDFGMKGNLVRRWREMKKILRWLQKTLLAVPTGTIFVGFLLPPGLFSIWHHLSRLFENPQRVLVLVLYTLVAFGCSPDDPEPRQILGHSVATKGVFHGEPKEFAGRYCETCHGLNLVGGVEFQPSCYQCHGKTWKLVPPNVSRAPADHVVDFGGFRHHPQYKNPTGYCNACHGFKLEGGLIQRTPSCLLCHDKKW